MKDIPQCIILDSNLLSINDNIAELELSAAYNSQNVINVTQWLHCFCGTHHRGSPPLRINVQVIPVLHQQNFSIADPVKIVGDCDFEDKSLCRYYNDPSANLKWNWKKAVVKRSGPAYDHTLYTNQG